MPLSSIAAFLTVRFFFFFVDFVFKKICLLISCFYTETKKYHLLKNIKITAHFQSKKLVVQTLFIFLYCYHCFLQILNFFYSKIGKKKKKNEVLNVILLGTEWWRRGDVFLIIQCYVTVQSHSYNQNFAFALPLDLFLRGFFPLYNYLFMVCLRYSGYFDL